MIYEFYMSNGYQLVIRLVGHSAWNTAGMEIMLALNLQSDFAFGTYGFLVDRWREYKSAVAVCLSMGQVVRILVTKLIEPALKRR